MTPHHIPTAGPGRWAGIDILRYKEDGTEFRDVTRQVLCEGDGLGAQWRYFEVGPRGHSTLERHEHVHCVLILRGSGACLVGNTIYPLREHDLVNIPPLTWHQFRAFDHTPLGFLCLVPVERDRPQRPDAAQLAALRQDPQVDAFIRA
jgi:mannose-6-phosphate isomerase-like protein (cupin superfamily)